MTVPPERPWAGTAWDTVVVVPPSRWRRLWPLLAVAAAVLTAGAVVLGLALFVDTAEKQSYRRLPGVVLSVDDRIAELTPGTCVDEVGTADRSSLEPVPCRKPHDGEITALAVLPRGPWPGEDKVVEESDAACDAAADHWVGDGPGADVDLDVSYFYDSEQGWEDDHPTTLCYVVSPKDKGLSAPLNLQGTGST